MLFRQQADGLLLPYIAKRDLETRITTGVFRGRLGGRIDRDDGQSFYLQTTGQNPPYRRRCVPRGRPGMSDES